MDPVYAIPVESDPTLSPESPDPATRDLVTEAHLRALSIWYRVAGVLGAILGVVVAALLFLLVSALAGVFGEKVPMDLFVLAGAAAVAVSVVLFFVGRGLGRHHDGARIGAVVLLVLLALPAAVSLVWPRFGPAGFVSVALELVFVGAQIQLLVSARARAVCQPTYRALMAATPRVRASLRATPWIWIPPVYFLCTRLIFVALRHVG